MFPTLLVTASIGYAPLAELADDLMERSLYGHKPAYFETRSKPLGAGLAKANEVILHEGLTRQLLSEQLRVSQLSEKERTKELKDKKTVAFRQFHFYEAAVTPKGEDAKALLALCADVKTFGRFAGDKMCDGFHPDWWVELKGGDVAHHVLICFGCHEARLVRARGRALQRSGRGGVQEVRCRSRPPSQKSAERHRE